MALNQGETAVHNILSTEYAWKMIDHLANLGFVNFNELVEYYEGTVEYKVEQENETEGHDEDNNLVPVEEYPTRPRPGTTRPSFE